MKTIGIILLIAGLIMTLTSGFSFVTKEKVVDLGELQISRDKEHSINWQPYVGIGVMVIGTAVLLVGRKKTLTA